MSEHPVLTLKRRPTAGTPAPESTGDMTLVVRRRKTVVDVLRVLTDCWPQLFNPELPLRLMKMDIRGEMEADIVVRQLPISVKRLRRCLRSLTRSEAYMNATVPGSIRYGLDGQPAGTVTEEEYRLSRLRLEKVLQRRGYTGSEPA